MKSDIFGKGSRNLGPSSRCALTCVGVIAFASVASANVTLTDDNSTLTIDPNSSSGVNSWLVEGQQQLFTQWFWYRVGEVGAGTREFSIDTLSAPTVTSSANSATISYTNSLFNLSVTYLLGGGVGGSGQSTLNEDILIVNKTGTVLNLQFFQYSDFDLAGNAEGDNVLLYTSTSPFELAYQWDGTIGLTEGIVTVNPFASRGAIGVPPTIYNSLEDGAVTDLSTSVGGPLGPGDVEFAFQWDLEIAANDSVSISKIKNLNVYVIPEPATSGLSLMGLALLAIRRFRREV